ncbi:hypothetical protein [Phytoactinopolyspora endophytica]|uniref:hypothetical protein n=1 Tax=Phytoactinopolyspora endophytica TaxID=1642495 RepID=UPI001F0EF84A|nr:hypothetical protein [Phytoactinopolyspora endophytica]
MSHAVRVRDAPVVVLSLVFDVGTGLTLATSVAPTRRDACVRAFKAALSEDDAPLPPQRPGRVLSAAAHIEDVTSALEDLLTDAEMPVIDEIVPGPDIEDVVDSLVGHMSGRRQPEERPTPDDWQLLMTLALDYYRSEPWTRWSDTDHHDLVVRVDRVAARYVAVVFGKEGIERGLALHPGAVLPDELLTWQPGQPATPAQGTLMCYFDAPSKTPSECAAKAYRYGWPADADSVPVLLVTGPEGVADIGRRDSQHVALGLAAVLGREYGTEAGVTTAGGLDLADGVPGEYTVR